MAKRKNYGKRTGRVPSPSNGQQGPPRRPQRHRHREAFCLMTYRCEKCLRAERLWNSRDGVTPFMIGCRQAECDGMMQHVDWGEDRYVPNYVPDPGQRVFIDMPESLKRPLALWLIKQWARDVLSRAPELTMEEQGKLLRSIVTGFQEGEPWIITWPTR